MKKAQINRYNVKCECVSLLKYVTIFFYSEASMQTKCEPNVDSLPIVVRLFSRFEKNIVCDNGIL